MSATPENPGATVLPPPILKKSQRPYAGERVEVEFVLHIFRDLEARGEHQSTLVHHPTVVDPTSWRCTTSRPSAAPAPPHPTCFPSMHPWIRPGLVGLFHDGPSPRQVRSNRHIGATSSLSTSKTSGSAYVAMRAAVSHSGPGP